MSDYTPPELTEDEHKQLHAQVQQWVRARGVAHIPKLLGMLVVENASLTKEINRLRRELGIPERDTYEIK